MLADSSHIQQEDAKYLQRKLGPGAPRVEPLYDDDDVAGVVKNFVTVPYGEWHDLSKDFRLRFSDAGHILGSASVDLRLRAPVVSQLPPGRRVTFASERPGTVV